MVPNCVWMHVANLNILIKEGPREAFHILYDPYREFERYSLSVEIS